MHNNSMNEQGALSFKGLRGEWKQGAEAAEELLATFPLLTRVIFGLLMLLAGALAGTVTPLLRRNAGLLTTIVHGTLGIALLMLAFSVLRGVDAIIIGLWLLLLTVVVIVQTTARIRRLYAPGLTHVHRWSAGLARWPFSHMLRNTGRAVPGLSNLIDDYGEAVFPALLAIIFAVLSEHLGGPSASEGPAAWMVAMGGALGIVFQQLVSASKHAWRVQLLFDQQQEQNLLAQAMQRGAGGSRMRPSDGVARIL